MKAKSVILSILSMTAAIGVMIWLAVGHRARLRLGEENTALRQRLDQMAGLVAENDRLSNLLAQASSPQSLPNEPAQAQPLPSERLKELLRLRGEVGVLRQQSKELAVLREDTRAARESSLKTQNARHAATTDKGIASQASQLEIVKAQYWTDSARMDVTGDLRDRIRGDSLKAIADNDIKGDPEFGQTKRLTVEYKFAGVPMTNEFREGDTMILPPE
jgi:hypothetical protein